MNLTTRLLLASLQAHDFVRFENGVFSFKPSDSDWNKLVDMKIVDKNGNFVGRGAQFQMIPDWKKGVSDKGLDKATVGLIQELKSRVLNQGLQLSQEAIEQIADLVNTINGTHVIEYAEESVEFLEETTFAI